MLNLIPALFLFLATSPFGPSSGDALARIDTTAPKALAIQIARELERAGLTAAQAALVMASCEESPAETPSPAPVRVVLVPVSTGNTDSGFARNARPRDGPAL